MRREQALRIGHAGRLGEIGRVDDVAPVAGQRHAVTGFQIRRPRFGVLPRKTADADHALLESVHQHQAHLQQHLEPVGDDVWRAVGKTLGAIAALQHKLATGRGIGELLAQRHNLPGGDQRRHVTELIQHGLKGLGIRVLGLLHGLIVGPRGWRPLTGVRSKRSVHCA